MDKWELYIAPEKPQHNARTGRFLPGHTPFNKGKKWEDYASKGAQRRMRKGWKNLKDHRPKKRPDTAARCRKMVVAVRDDGSWVVFTHIGEAGASVEGHGRNVSRCCSYNLERHVNKKTGKVNTDHKYNGVRFYYESDPIWMEKIAK